MYWRFQCLPNGNMNVTVTLFSATQDCAAPLLCVIFLCFATQGCAALRSLIVVQSTTEKYFVVQRSTGVVLCSTE